MIRVYNTLEKKVTEVKKPKFKALKLFVCGPTVYDNPHIGNARTFMFFDMWVKYLRSKNYKVYYLMNITNIDDKIIAKAKEQGTSPEEVAKKYENIFLLNMEKLNINAVDTYARSTEHIQDIIRQVQKLVKKRRAYKIENDGWYFDLSTFEDYGKLSGRTVVQAEDGVSRIDQSKNKKNAGDFCLWKLSRAPEDLATLVHAHHQKKVRLIDGEPSWESPLGWGRPGWHIEDTATTENFFGPQYDIHGGALDLMFPHHEAEIALQESISGKKPLAKTWLHPGFLTVLKNKMSKSKGNFITIDEMLEKFPGDIFRMFVFSSHYRSPIDYSEDSMEQAKKNLLEVKALLAKLDLVGKKDQDTELDSKGFLSSFFENLDNDFASPGALASLFDFIRILNTKLGVLNKSQAKEAKDSILRALSSVGFSNLEFEIPAEVKDLVQERELSRDNKQFNKSDALRKKIGELGYTVEDLEIGPLVLPKE